MPMTKSRQGTPGEKQGITDLHIPAGPPPLRQCGRCRLAFEGDPTLYPSSQQSWWLCPSCREILLGSAV